MQIHPLIAELERRDQARAHLADYSIYMEIGTPALHHKLICDAMDDLLADLYDELIILAPPGSAKSTYTSIALPSYFMGKYPHGHILTASYSSELAEKWGRRVRNILDTPKFDALFDVKLSKDSTASARWATANGGEFYAAGVGSGILGFRADLAVIDDPIAGFEQAQSMSQLQKIHGWYETDFVTRLKPQGKTVLICQRLARNDLAGYLIDRNAEKQTRRQRIIKLPMLSLGSEIDPLHRPEGERLWPEWFTAEMVIDAKRDDYKWRTLYQQEPPSDEGTWVTPEEIQIIDVLPANLKHYLLTDLALSVNSGDYSVHITAGTTDKGDIYVVDAWRSRCSIEQTADKHIELVQTYSPTESLIDDDNAAKVYVQFLASRCREVSAHVPWKSLPMRGQDKETRAGALRGLFKSKKVYLLRAEWNKWLVKELLTFPNALGEGVDDGVDALGLLGRRLASLARPVTAVPTPKQPTVQSMTLNELWEDRERGQGIFGQGRV